MAGRLELEADQAPDPHVERLIESVAFLTARIQRTIDDDYPQIAAELLELLHPHYLRPLPPITVARFDVDPDRGKLTTGHLLPKHTQLFTQSDHGQVCRFRTCYPVTLWPLELVSAGFESPAQFDFLDSSEVATVLRLKLETRADPIGELDLKRLRFHLHGDKMTVATLYELLSTRVHQIALLADGGGRPRILPAENLLPVGFALDEEVLPYPRYSQPAYRLLQEYFVFPDKFDFFDVDGLEGSGAEQSLDLLLLLRRGPRAKVAVNRDNFLLGCTPVVNLFSKISEPIRIDRRRTEYRLVADARREATTEIHTVGEVSGSADFAQVTKEYRPFYSFDHQMARHDHSTYWHARRVPAVRDDMTGTDLLLSFVDLDFNPSLPPTDMVYARTLCSNRELAEQIPAGGLLDTDEAAPLARIVCLKKPTQAVPPPLDGQTLWRLVSHLSLNHLSLTGEDSLKALREILKLYCYTEDAPGHQQIAGIREMSHRRVVRRIGREAWRGFCSGTEITLVFDEDRYVGTNAFLLGAVLNHFFALYSSTNNFTQLVIRSWQREGEWKRWPPMAGEKTLL